MQLVLLMPSNGKPNKIIDTMKKLLLIITLSLLCNFAFAQIGFNGGSSGTNRIGNLDSITSAKGLTIVGKSIFTQSATSSLPGLINNSTQTLSGNKTLYGVFNSKATQASVFNGLIVENTNQGQYSTSGAGLKLISNSSNSSISFNDNSNSNGFYDNALNLNSPKGINLISNGKNGQSNNINLAAFDGQNQGIFTVNVSTTNPRVLASLFTNNAGGTYAEFRLTESSSNQWIKGYATNKLTFGINSTEVMSLNSTGLTINGTNPLKLSGIQNDASPVKLLTIGSDSLVKRISVNDIDLDFVTSFNNICTNEVKFNNATWIGGGAPLLINSDEGSKLYFSHEANNSAVHDDNATHNNDIYLPDTSGTLVASVNGVLANSKGNVNVYAFPTVFLHSQDYTVTENDYNIIYTDINDETYVFLGGITSTNPHNGRTLVIKAPFNNNSHVLTITNDIGTIEGVSEIYLNSQTACVTLVYDANNNNWVITQAYRY